MKNQFINLTFLLSIFLLTTVVSCGSDDDDSSSNNSGGTIQQNVQTNIQSGTWRVTKYIDSGDDETYHFTGYNFTFANNGVLTATNGTNTYAGIWSISDDNSDDDTQNDLHFIIAFSVTNNFEELNDDWDFVSQSATKIELYDVSGGNGGTDYLTFEKN